MHRFLLAFLSLLLLPAAGRAQRVYWDTANASLQYNQSGSLPLVFADCSPSGDVKLPAVDSLAFGTPSQNSQTEIVNFHASSSYTLIYPAQPSVQTPITIPAFDVATNKGLMRVPAVTLPVGQAALGDSGPALDTIASSRLTPAHGDYWAGEIFPITHTLSLARRYFPSLGSPIIWNSAPLTIEEWSAPAQAASADDTRLGIQQRTRGYAKLPGAYTLAPATEVVNFSLSGGNNPFQIFSNFPQVTQKTITSNRPRIVIKPLPAPAPDGFSGAVGQFTLTSHVVPLTAAVGNPVTWTLTLAGTGNWPDIPGLPAREVSRDFQAIPSQPKRTTKANSLFDGAVSEDIVLIPSRPGSYTLGPVAYAYFDPQTGAYKTLTTAPTVITITPAPSAAAGNPAAPNLSTPFAAASPRPSLTPIPRDPLPGRALGGVPLAGATLALLCLLPPLIVFLLGWFWLALIRARQTDPWRARRQARAALARVLATLRADLTAAGSPPSSSRSELLRLWQYHTSLLLQLPGAAPTPAALAPLDPATGFSPWAALWSDADRVLYREDAALPADWIDRADAALQARPVPAWSSASIFTRRNLLPFFFACGVFALFSTPRLPAQTPETVPTGSAASALSAYRRGDFAAAEKSWRHAVAQAPADWIARHDLALALAQQDRWPEAAAEWTSAFVLNPRSDLVRWHLPLAYAHAGFAPAGLADLAQSGPLASLATIASPAEWQELLIALALLTALAALLGLWRAYRGPNAWFRPAAWAALAVIVVAAAAAVVSLRAYGLAADSRAALVWRDTTLRSIPTEAGTTQKTSPLAAGTLAIVDKTFLGWDRLAFPDGQTGWVRADDLVPLYQ